MKTSTRWALAAALLLMGAAPSFAQGVSQSPPSPNAAESSPQPPNSLPKGARTLPAGTTGIQRMGTVTTRAASGATATNQAPVQP